MMKSSLFGFNPHYGEDEPTLEEVRDYKGDTILEFGAPWCGHCQAALPAVHNVLANHSELLHIKVFDGKGKKLGRLFRVKLWPTLIVLHAGEEIARIERPLTEHDIEHLLNFVKE